MKPHALLDKEAFSQALYARTPFSQETMRRLWESSVGIVGLGSGGSAIALGLARAGVGELRLADPKSLTLANVSRHELGLSSVGFNKAEGVAARIRDINPHIKVCVFPCDLFTDESEDECAVFFEELGLVIASTDRTSIQLRVNREAVDRGIPAIFGGCYESARGGEVLFWLPNLNTPCLECLRGGLTQPASSSEIDYSSASGPEDPEGEPGLHAAIDLINSIETQVALAVLLRDELFSELGKLIHPKLNFLLIGGARAQGFYRFRRAFDIFWQPLAGPRSDCGACQAERASWTDQQVAGGVLDEISAIPEDLKQFL